MTKNILYFLIGSVLSFCIQQKGQATDLGQITDHPLSSSPSVGSKKTIGANYFLPLGKGEVVLFEDYKKDGAPVDIHEMRVYLMPWIYTGLDIVITKARFVFNVPIKLAEGLYEDYKPIYDAFREAYEQDSENGQDLFINKAVSQFKIDADYARILYDALKPSPFTLKKWQEYKQASSSSSSSAASIPPQETAEDQLKKLLLSNTLNSGSAAAAKTPPLQEEKEQILEVESPYVSSTKPLAGLRRRNLSPPK